MGFFQPTEPPFEIEEWRRLSHLERIKPLAQDWAENGFGTPIFVYLLYVVKLILYAGGGLLLISATTPGLGGLGNLSDWWTEPIVFEKAVVWTMLWEVLGLGAGSLPLTLRFSPMIGGVLYWLRPGTVRLPPWPDRVPLTRGNTRTILDVGLYAGLLVSAALSAALERHLRRRRRSGPPRPGRGRGAARLPGDPRPPRQGPVPRRPGRGLRQPDDRLPLPADEHDHRLPADLHLHLVGGGVLEAQPPLPVRRHRDDQQHALEPVEGGEAAPLPRPPRRPAALIDRRPRRPPRDRDRVHPAADPARLGGRDDRDDRRRRDDHLPPPHPLDVPARGPAGVEHLHDLRAAVPVRALRRHLVLDARRSRS